MLQRARNLSLLVAAANTMSVVPLSDRVITPDKMASLTAREEMVFTDSEKHVEAVSEQPAAGHFIRIGNGPKRCMLQQTLPYITVPCLCTWNSYQR